MTQSQQSLSNEELAEKLRADADYIRRNQHASVVPFAANRIEEAAARLAHLSRPATEQGDG